MAMIFVELKNRLISHDSRTIEGGSIYGEKIGKVPLPPCVVHTGGPPRPLMSGKGPPLARDSAGDILCQSMT